MDKGRQLATLVTNNFSRSFGTRLRSKQGLCAMPVEMVRSDKLILFT